MFFPPKWPAHVISKDTEVDKFEVYDLVEDIRFWCLRWRCQKLSPRQSSRQAQGSISTSWGPGHSARRWEWAWARCGARSTIMRWLSSCKRSISSRAEEGTPSLPSCIVADAFWRDDLMALPILTKFEILSDNELWFISEFSIALHIRQNKIFIFPLLSWFLWGFLVFPPVYITHLNI